MPANNLSRQPAPTQHPLIAVYGSLRKGQRANHYLDNHGFNYVGQDTIKGTLFPVGWFPGWQQFGDTAVVVDVYEVLDEDALKPIHRYEGYSETYPDESLFKLVSTRLQGNEQEVMCYEYNGGIGSVGKAIDHGDWAEYVAAKRGDTVS